MATIVSGGNLKTIEQLTWKIVNTITTGCKRVNLVAGSYQKASWKNSRHKNRGSGEEIMIKSAKSKIRDWQSFMKCSNNKTQMINIMFRYVQTAKVKILNKVRTTIMYLSQENHCCSVTLPSQNERVEELTSSHEEADYQLLLGYFLNQCSPALWLVLMSTQNRHFIYAIINLHTEKTAEFLIAYVKEV